MNNCHICDEPITEADRLDPDFLDLGAWWDDDGCPLHEECEGDVRHAVCHRMDEFIQSVQRGDVPWRTST